MATHVYPLYTHMVALSNGLTALSRQSDSIVFGDWSIVTSLIKLKIESVYAHL